MMNDETVSSERVVGEMCGKVDIQTHLPFPNAKPESQGEAEISNSHEDKSQDTVSEDDTHVMDTI